MRSSPQIHLAHFDAPCHVQVEKRARSFGAMECLIFLDGLSRLHEGMDEDRTRWMGVS